MRPRSWTPSRAGTEYFSEGTIRGKLYLDGNENDVYEARVDGDLPADSVTITLEGSSVNVNMTTMTDSAGEFEFTGLDAGSYRVWIDPKDDHLEDWDVDLRGTNQSPLSALVEMAEGAGGEAHFGFDVTKFTAHVPVVYGNDKGTENPADGITVTLYTQPQGVSGRDEIGDAESDSTGMASIEIERETLADLPAQSIVFAEVSDPDPETTAEDNDRDVSADEVVTFTLDKSSFSTTADEDHNLLWRNITVTANYFDADGMPVRAAVNTAVTSNNEANASAGFDGDFVFRAKSSDDWAAAGGAGDNVQATRTDKKSGELLQVSHSLVQVDLPTGSEHPGRHTHSATASTASSTSPTPRPPARGSWKVT